MRLISPRQFVARKSYRSERMTKIRSDVLQWMQEYESAHTAKHRAVCMEHIKMNLKKMEYYGHWERNDGDSRTGRNL